MNKEERIINVLTLIGALFMLAGFLGAVVPGLDFHVYIGTNEGALEWHKENSEWKK